MSESTQTEESVQYTSEYSFADTSEYEQNRFIDQRDLIILENQKKIQLMQKNFKATAAEMRTQLTDICEQSAKLQYAMLDRILQLKEKIKEINERNAFCKRKLPSTKAGTRRKIKQKKPKQSAYAPNNCSYDF